MPGYGYHDQPLIVFANFRWLCTFRINVLPPNFRVVHSVYALTFLNEVPLSELFNFLADFASFLSHFGLPQFEVQYCFRGRNLFYILPGDFTLKELLDFFQTIN